MTYQVEVWNYSEAPETLEKLITRLRETPEVVVLRNRDTDNGVFLFGGAGEVNSETEAEFVCKSLNEFYSKETI